MFTGPRLLLLLLLFCGLPASAQLRASFNADKPSGCAPLAVQFTNTSTGGGTGVIWKWSFSNGNASHLKDPAALFTEPGTYTVTLRAEEGNATSEQSLTVTVYPAPAAAVSVSLPKGCAPLPLTWTATPAPGAPAIREYLWDFGDGQVETAFAPSVQHTYTAAARPSVSLTVTSVNGCRSTVVQDSLVQVLPRLHADFTTPDAVLCHLTEPARFTNTSGGPGELTYQWTFGDNTTSTEKDPSKIFSQRGTYGVRLRVVSSEGCVAEKSLPTPINAAQFGSDFTLPAPLCTGTYLEFVNTTTAQPQSAVWNFGNGQQSYTYGRGSGYSGFDRGGNYTITLINSFGRCRDTVTKTVPVSAAPQVSGFIADLEHHCGAPVKVTFKDTTAGATSWAWSYMYGGTGLASTQSFVKQYTGNIDDWVHLTVGNAAGCRTMVSRYIQVKRPYARIERSDAGNWQNLVACGPLRVRLKGVTDREVTSWKWKTGDGATYTTEELDHTYSTPGFYMPTLVFTTRDGCTDSVTFNEYISIKRPVVASFKANDSTICGNTPVFFTATSPPPEAGTYWQWDFGDGTWANHTGVQQSAMHQYRAEGTYTVRYILNNMGCADTAELQVRAFNSFPKITGFQNSCEGSRGTVTLKQDSRGAESWQWDFGDGTFSPVYTTNQPQVTHTYGSNGWYKVVLITKAGDCVNRDSVMVPVYLKQQPKLTLSKADVCQSEDYLTIKVHGYERNPTMDNYYFSSGYSWQEWHYRDGTPATLLQGTYPDHNDTSVWWQRSNFTHGQEGFRVVVRSAFFNCIDTTNYAPLRIRGPKAVFRELPPGCRTDNLFTAEDGSDGKGSTIVRREWHWGDATPNTLTSATRVSHQYNWPSQYYVSLKVTDAQGCSDQMFQWAMIRARSVEARITPSATTVSPGTAVHFSNSSTSAGGAFLQYQWTLPGGSASTNQHADYAFNTPGTYTVRLIATDPQTGCADTASVSILVKYINSVFSMNRTMVGTASCPPVMVRFQNFSQNAARTVWDFGDGTIIEGVTHPAHVYTRPGRYTVRLDTYSDNGTRYTTIDSVIITAPAARILSEGLEACTAQDITLQAESDAAATYLWDFGDGTVGRSDALTTHRYARAGQYKPRLLVADAGGCLLPATGSPQVLIDSLAISVGALPPVVCGPKDILFQPHISSVSEGAGRTLSYHWSFGTGRPEDTSDLRAPRFAYGAAGSYTVQLRVASAAGCVKETTGTIVVKEGLGASISGPEAVCAGTPVTLQGTTRVAGNPQWTWILEDGQRISGAALPSRTFTAAGEKTFRLLVDNGGCTDTLTHKLTVHGLPVITLNTREGVVCAGSPLPLTAAGAATYQWSPAAGLDRTEGATVMAHPSGPTTYLVTGTSAAGCVSNDSVRLRITVPVSIAVAPAAAPCAGDPVTLQAEGAALYTWSGPALSAGSGATVQARPSGTSTYQVIGGDRDGCFRDTVEVTVQVRPRPSVDAGSDHELNPGATVTLQPVASADVAAWKWTPSEGLSCTDCPAPIAAPKRAMTYTVEVRNNAGCTAADSLQVALLCSGSQIFMPTAFSPNGDGKNDRFTFGTTGIRRAESIRIYNRWGELVFEKRDFDPADESAAWRGTFKGQPVPAGGYVYFLELSCEGEKFVRKGTVMVLH